MQLVTQAAYFISQNVIQLPYTIDGNVVAETVQGINRDYIVYIWIYEQYLVPVNLFMKQ